MLRRVDDLEQLLADLRGVAGRDLAVADDAVERRAHFGALQLLARRHHARAWRPTRSLCALLRRISASSSACGRRHARARSVFMRWNWRSACSSACAGGAHRFLGRRQAVADRRVVEAHQQVATLAPARRFP